MPATGVRPPFLTLVAVRAIAPVAGIPPKRADATLAMPCPTSSTLDLWRLPIMPSATTAESSDSIAARSATVTADGKSSRTRSSAERGKLGAGNRSVDLAEPRSDRLDRDPSRAAAAAEASRMTTIGPGTRRETLGQITRIDE